MAFYILIGSLIKTPPLACE